MKLKFWGAARTVTGSMHLLQLENGRNLLLDCGLYQGDEDFALEYNTSFPCEPFEIDYLILSHAHIDHCGNIPQLVKAGFQGPIFCTHATYDLSAVLLRDSAGIQEKDALDENRRRAKKGLDPIEPLYTTADVAPALANAITLPYDRWHRIDEGIEVMFLDAGHMLGSGSVNLRITANGRTVTIGFTGDIGRPHSPILRDPKPMVQCDYLICESTYGGQAHPSQTDSKEHLLQVIQETCVRNRGKLIIPAFSVGRTQNIVYTLDQLHNEGRLPRIPVYVDSPLSVNATEVFQMHPECFDEELSAYMQHDANPFGFNSLHYIRNVEDSKRLNKLDGPFVVIAASGMMNAGRVVHHLRNGIEDPRNTVLVTGFCAEGTLGAKLVRGDETIRIHGEEYRVRARIEKMSSFSGHADQAELSQFLLKSIDPAQTYSVFLVHGEEERSLMFQEHLKSLGFKHVVVPERGDVIAL